MPQLDENGELIPDPSMPLDVQGSEVTEQRWKMCAQLAAQMSGEPEGSPDTWMVARWLYDSPVPTFDAPDPEPELAEADWDFEHLHPRDRRGEFLHKIGKLRTPEHPDPPRSPGVGPDELEDFDISHPSPLALEILQGHDTSAARWHASRARMAMDPTAYPVYKAQRRRRHDLIVGRMLAGIPDSPEKPLRGIASLLGRDHAITQKLAKGGRLTAEEKGVVRDAAHAARGGESPDALFMAGGTAAGKTGTLEANPELAPEHAVLINTDPIKEQLPEFRKLVAARDRYAARAVHQESGDIAERVVQEASDLGMNAVIDGTGNNEPEEFIRLLRRKHDNGYDVGVLYATVPTEEGVRRSITRGYETGRFVPLAVVREKHAKVSRNFPYVAKLPFLESLDVFQDGDHLATLGADGVDVLDQPRFQAFLDKANELD